MSTRSQLTKDLNDSVTALLGKRIKILLKNVVKLETKGDKTENRVLVFSPCRLFLLTAKVPTRIDCHFHYLEIKGIEARKENTISFLIGEKWYTFICQNGEVESMLHALSAALQVIFPGVALQEMMSRVSLDGLDWEEILPEPSGVPPCGGFSTQYACMCDYHGLTYRDEVAWDVDTIYVSHNTRELNLKDFEHLEPKDMVPIISALEHNRWFTGFKAANIKLTHEAFDRILHVFSRSITLESLTLHNLSLRPDAINRLSSAIVSNPNTPLNSLDLSNNPAIEDKGVNSLCAILTKLVQDGKGVSKLNLSNIGLGGKGVAQLTQCLATLRPSTLVYLNLSGAVIKDELNGLLNLLAEPNAITHLDVSNTDIVLDTVFGALLRGCSTSLVHLNLSKNSFSVKKSKEMPPSFKQFFTSTLALKYLNMSHCKLPLEALKNLLLGLACNESTAGLKLDISSNCLGSQGAHVLESCIHGVRSLSSLDISDNGLESELGGVVAAVGKNKSITELMLCRNLAGLKAKHLAPVVDSIIHTIQEDDCPIQSLSLADCKLKSELHPIINALGSNQCLTSLDISGNGMGDLGARLLSKALQTNCKLKSVIFDRNNITFQGLSDIAYAMQSNYSVTYVGCLLHDVIPSMKLSPDKTEQALSAIYRALYRNSDPSNTKVLRRQHVFARLQDIAEGGDLNSPIQHKLSSASQEVAVILQKHVAGRVDEMISTAEELCGSRVMSDRLKAELKASVAPRLSLDQDFLSSVVVTQPATQITLKASEMGLTAATHLAEKITDEVVDLLNKTQTSLLGGKRSSTPDVLRMMPRQLPDPLHPLATPQLINRRKSLHSRKLRPTSAVDTVSAEHIPDLLPSISNSPQGSHLYLSPKPLRLRLRHSYSLSTTPTFQKGPEANLNEAVVEQGLIVLYEKTSPT